MEHEITDTKIIYEVWVNSDLTEGRGFQLPLMICEKEATARRLGKGQDVQGSNAQIVEGVALRIKNKWYAPCRIVPSTKVDDEREEKLIAKKAAIKKAKQMGLSLEEIENMSRSIRFE